MVVVFLGLFDNSLFSIMENVEKIVFVGGCLGISQLSLLQSDSSKVSLLHRQQVLMLKGVEWPIAGIVFRECL